MKKILMLLLAVMLLLTLAGCGCLSPDMPCIPCL